MKPIESRHAAASAAADFDWRKAPTGVEPVCEALQASA